MGMGLHELNALRYASTRRGPLGRVLTLGRQNFTVEAKRRIARLGWEVDFGEKYIDALLIQSFGAVSVNSMDISAFEGADIIWDLNSHYIGNPDLGKFDTILDFGTLEHVYNVPVALETVQNLLAVGGQVIHSLPTNGSSGHGMYQFAPNFFRQIYSETNGYSDTETFLTLVGSLGWSRYWWRFEEQIPRLEPFSGPAISVLVIASKSMEDSEKKSNIYQSDYEVMWEGNKLPSGRIKSKIKLIIEKFNAEDLAVWLIQLTYFYVKQLFATLTFWFPMILSVPRLHRLNVNSLLQKFK